MENMKKKMLKSCDKIESCRTRFFGEYRTDFYEIFTEGVFSYKISVPKISFESDNGQKSYAQKTTLKFRTGALWTTFR